MDMSIFLSTLVGGFFTLVGAFGAIYWTNLLDRKKEAKTKYIQKIEEIGACLPQLYRWYEEESTMYWDVVQEECTYDPHPNKYPCPFFEIENLVNWWIPSLSNHVQEVGKVFSFFEDLRGYEGAREYTPTGNMEQLGGDLRKYNKVFKENYECIRRKIGKEAKKMVANG